MNTAIKVSIYEANVNFLESLSFLICRTDGFELCSASPYTGDILAECHDNYPDVILMDIDMPEQAGIEATRLVKEVYPDINITVTDAQRNVGTNYTATASPTVPNSSITLTNATTQFDIGPAPLNIVAVSETIDYGQTPVLAYTVQSGQLFGSDALTGALSVATQNPTQGKVTVLSSAETGAMPNESSGKASIQVYDMNGAIVMQPETNPFDMSALPQGMYFIKVNGEAVKVIKKN